MSSARISLGRVFRAESSNYFMLLGLTLFMVVFGLIMVLSSSSVVSHATTNNFFSAFWSQGIFALIGLPLMLIASRMPSRFWKKSAWVLLGASCLLQVVVLTTPLGLPAVGGNRNWLHIGGLTGQPSEAIKVALALWLGVVLARKRDLLGKWKHVVIPLIPIGGGAILLVTIGGDLGTTMIMAGFVLGSGRGRAHEREQGRPDLSLLRRDECGQSGCPVADQQWKLRARIRRDLRRRSGQLTCEVVMAPRGRHGLHLRRHR
jgi:hypothetical protein